MTGNSKPVETDQEGIHPDLEKSVLRYLESEYRRPIAEHTRSAFEKAEAFLRNFRESVVLDSGCGTGLSTLALSRMFPGNPVIGVDKSEVRLGKADSLAGRCGGLPSNVLYVRAELVDFWRLALKAKWEVHYHALYYPNPWPKKSELGNRFHGHPVFPDLVKLSPRVEMRTNWKIYADEFACAWNLASEGLNLPAEIRLEPFAPGVPVSAFEKKFQDSGHALWRVTARRADCR